MVYMNILFLLSLCFAWNYSLDHTTVTLGGYLGILFKDKNLRYSHVGFAVSFMYITQ
jgi:hypothetical protein